MTWPGQDDSDSCANPELLAVRRQGNYATCMSDICDEQLAEEAARFTPGLPVILHHGVARSKGASFKKAAANTRWWCQAMDWCSGRKTVRTGTVERCRA